MLSAFLASLIFSPFVFTLMTYGNSNQHLTIINHSFVVVRELLFLILTHILGRRTTAQVLTWDITLHTDVIAVSKIAKGKFVFAHAYVIIIMIITTKTMIIIVIMVMVISITIP